MRDRDADDHATLEVLDGRNLPSVLPRDGFDVAAAALERDEVVDDYGADLRADPRVTRLGFRTVAATPILGGGGRDAVLVAASYRWQTVGIERREVLELASHALATMSIGLAVHEPEGDPMVTLARADRSLYEAKEGGRDRVRAG